MRPRILEVTLAKNVIFARFTTIIHIHYSMFLRDFEEIAIVIIFNTSTI